ncbi:hypothetical protein HOLleu_04444 [Holothuria leucospilota]|uniref:Uncharacterized protein n=1 Tax=Holothuria leucospilota TaxID=206669 RepID=A0A9Q1HI90_HOLLE|nr:hypothetical protein HOLleu_04444 [Holothuria leucospilota]
MFTGDVREYWTFKDDFRHMIEPLYEPSDAVSILRTSLTGRPLEMLRGIGKESDMNNNHMLAIIEQKMTPDDRKVWTRHLQQTSEEASLKNLLNFVTDEMKDVLPVKYDVIRKMESVVSRPLSRGDGAVDMLIGVNYPQMHVDETREVDGYVIRRSPLGWIMLGVSDGRGPPNSDEY